MGSHDPDRESVSRQGAAPDVQEPFQLLRSAEGMPRWVPKLLWWILLLTILLLIGIRVADNLGSLLLTLGVSLFLSAALEPGVNWLAARGMRRGLATFLIMAAIAVSGLVVVGLMIPLLVSQLGALVQRIPGYVEDLQGVASGIGIDVSPDAAADATADLRSTLGSYADDLAGALFGVGSALLSTIFNLMMISLFTFYMTAEGPKMRRTVLATLPPERQRVLLRLWEISVEKTGGYFYSRLLLAAVSAAASFLVFWLTGLPFPLALAIWVGLISQFIPTVGTYIAGAVPVLIGLLDGGLGLGIGILVWIVVYQQVENILLSPRISERTMDLHPAIAFGAVIAGGALLGGVGALIALPVAATLQASISTYVNRYEIIETEFPSEEEARPSERRPRRKGRSQREGRRSDAKGDDPEG